MGFLVISATILLVLVLIAASFGPFGPRAPKEDVTIGKSETPALELVKPCALEPPKPRQDFSGVPERFVVFDLETTGLDADRHEIIEIGAIKISNLDVNVHAAFQRFVKPPGPIPHSITRLTGISQDMINRDGVPLRNVLQDFTEFVEDLPLVAFNAKFDMAFLRRAAKTCGIVITNPSSCALEMAREAWPDLPSHKLSYLAKTGGLSDDDTHRALGDCKRTVMVYTAAASHIYHRKMSFEE